jgi:TPR repeat protein
LAAEQGVGPAQFDVGLKYERGEGVPQDYREAAQWYSLAAEQGYVNAQLNLGALYFEGKGVPQDYVQAHIWFNLASANGSTKAADDRELVAQKMTPDQIAEAQRRAREWKPKERRFSFP